MSFAESEPVGPRFHRGRVSIDQGCLLCEAWPGSPCYAQVAEVAARNEQRARIMSPEDLGRVLSNAVPGGALPFASAVAHVRGRDEQISAWCLQKAAEADREAETHEALVTGEHGHLHADASHHDRANYCEGQAAAFRALASTLRGLR